MIGGGVPKNFTQDVVVATDILGEEQPMHKYAVQITVADERDGALSGSTLQGSLLLGQGRHRLRADGLRRGDPGGAAAGQRRLHRGAWRKRSERRLNELFDRERRPTA